ncbi:hypothetical protein HPB50_019363 [Hyalomma asiaticum]|uniref:Uncharacterized protein n=1 Tax=Hyalomma asiaticum TaxID=266040 RepID=A0ACB7SH75_HYAAI|nr:hypothetical protein HPB50_019363 [Hyalomma asiaticum]
MLERHRPARQQLPPLSAQVRQWSRSRREGKAKAKTRLHRHLQHCNPLGLHQESGQARGSYPQTFPPAAAHQDNQRSIACGFTCSKCGSSEWRSVWSGSKHRSSRPEEHLQLRFPVIFPRKTLLLRRRGVCKNGGCYPFEPEDQKPKGFFRKVITNIDKFASGSYRKSVLKPGEQSGPIVSVLPSLLGGASKSATADGAPQLPSGPPPSTAGSPALSVGTSSLVKAVGSSLTSIWTHAFPLNLKAGPPRPNSAAINALPSTPPLTPGGTIAASTDRAAAVNFGGGPPIVPPKPAEGDNILASGTSRGPKLLGQVPGLTSALSFGRTLMKLSGRSSASTASTGKPLAPVGGINAGNAVGVREGEAGSVAVTSGTNAVKIATGAPKVSPPATPDMNKERPPTTSTLVAAPPRGGTVEASQGEKSGNGLLPRSPAIPEAAVNAGNAGTGTPRSEGGMSQPNASIISPSIAAPPSTQSSGKRDVAPGAPLGSKWGGNKYGSIWSSKYCTTGQFLRRSSRSAATNGTSRQQRSDRLSVAARE